MKRIILIISISFVCVTAKAQIIVKSSSQSLVELALDKSIFVVEQPYQLLDSTSGERYGRNGKDVFGSATSLCIKVNGGYYSLDRLLRPWEQDVNFEKYKGKYVPVCTQPIAHYIGCDSTFQVSEIKESSVELIGSGGYLRVTDPSFIDNSGLEVDGSVGKKEGWIVCVSDDKDAPYAIFKENVTVESTFDSQKVCSFVSPETKGGIFVIASQCAIGSVTFKLCGILSKKGDKWQIDFPFKGGGDKDELSQIQ